MSHQITEKEKRKTKAQSQCLLLGEAVTNFALFLACDEDMEIRNEIHTMCVILRATLVEIKAIYSLY